MKFNEARKLAIHLKRFETEINQLLTTMGNEAVNHFVKSFPNQGFEDETVNKWRPRKRIARKERGKADRAILIQSGRLWRSIRIVRRSKYSITVGTDVIYARRHNEGLSGMPKRQFIGNSAKLQRKLTMRLKKQIEKVFKN